MFPRFVVGSALNIELGQEPSSARVSSQKIYHRTFTILSLALAPCICLPVHISRLLVYATYLSSSCPWRSTSSSSVSARGATGSRKGEGRLPPHTVILFLDVKDRPLRNGSPSGSSCRLGGKNHGGRLGGEEMIALSPPYPITYALPSSRCAPTRCVLSS
jgi:hypothetical protein